MIKVNTIQAEREEELLNDYTNANRERLVILLSVVGRYFRNTFAISKYNIFR